jgi:hypothetical protein
MERYLLRFTSARVGRANARVVYLGGYHEDDVYDERVREQASRLDKRQLDFEYSENYKEYLKENSLWRTAVEAE